MGKYDNVKYIAVMDGVVSIFDKPKYVEPYGLIECPTKEDFIIAKGLIEEYYSNAVYILDGTCSRCGYPLDVHR